MNPSISLDEMPNSYRATADRPAIKFIVTLTSCNVGTRPWTWMEPRRPRLVVK
jgi:hypothetical protein